MPPVLIALLIALGLVSVLGFFVAPWATTMALGIVISVLLAAVSVLLAAVVAWGTWVYLNRPSRQR